MGGRRLSVSVLVPINPDGAERERHWHFLRSRLERLHPDYEIVEATCPGPGWSKGVAIHYAANAAQGDTFVIMDADVLVTQAELLCAVERAQTAPWVVPHNDVLRLDAEATAEFIASPCDIPPQEFRGRLERPVYRGVAAGGLVVFRREVYGTVGPPDPRFVGWGGEDIAWRRALDTIAGTHVRLPAQLWHLHHPPQPDRYANTAHSNQLFLRYNRLRQRRAPMLQLLEEARCHLPPLT